MILVNWSSFFFGNNTANGEFAVHQWTSHRQGLQVLCENVHIGAAQGNVDTGDICEYEKRIMGFKETRKMVNFEKSCQIQKNIIIDSFFRPHETKKHSESEGFWKVLFSSAHKKIHPWHLYLTLQPLRMTSI